MMMQWPAAYVFCQVFFHFKVNVLHSYYPLGNVKIEHITLCSSPKKKPKLYHNSLSMQCYTEEIQLTSQLPGAFIGHAAMVEWWLWDGLIRSHDRCQIWIASWGESGEGEEDFHANLNSYMSLNISLQGPRQCPILSHTSELMLRLAKRGSEFISYL